MYLTATSLKDFLMCPFKFKLGHIDRLRKKIPKAILAFGTTIHYSIAKFYIEQETPAETFSKIWLNEAETEYEFSNGDTHSSLHEQGLQLLSLWHQHSETPDPEKATSVERERYIEVAGEVPFWSTIDFTGENGELLLDWKTSLSRYPEHKVKLDLQLTAYAYVLAVTEKTPSRVGFGVLVKRKVPEVQYLFATRSKEELQNFERLVLKTWQDIEDGHFHRAPGAHCSWCDYLGLCLGEPEAEKDFVIMKERYCSCSEE